MLLGAGIIATEIPVVKIIGKVGKILGKFRE